MLIFDELARDDPEPRRHSQSQFDFLNHSSRDGIGHIRSMLEDWLSRYPEEHREEMRCRLRSDLDRHHRSAFFELYLYELLTGLGCQAMIHPTVFANTSKQPDFLVVAPNGTEFYLEATIATGKSSEEEAAAKRLNIVYDLINTIDSPNFFLEVESVESGTQQPSMSRPRKALTDWLLTLDPDAPAFDGDHVLQRLPTLRIEQADWKWTFRAIPKKKEARGAKGVRPIGAYPMEGSVDGQPITAYEAIRAALESKASRYGRPDKPYVIAVNGLDDFLSDEGILTALFGDEVVEFDRNHLYAEGRCYRAGNGFWGSAAKPAHTRVSGVLVFIRLGSANVLACSPLLYHNPWAENDLPANCLDVSQILPEGDHLVKRNSLTAKNAVSVPIDWPWPQGNTTNPNAEKWNEDDADDREWSA